MADPELTNRSFWNGASDHYQEQHGEMLESTALAWGVWRIPESDVSALGEVADRDVLEIGCGAAQWAVGLWGQGARVTALDMSERQLLHAQRRIDRAGVDVPLIQASGEALPLADESFDLVFCDHGVMTFARPEFAVPEAARVLRPGGKLVFCHASPLRDIAWDRVTDTIVPAFTQDYFALGPLEEDGVVSYQLAYGEWVRLFRRCSLAIEDLIELRPEPGAETSYDGFASLEWARRWPAENIWCLAKIGR